MVVLTHLLVKVHDLAVAGSLKVVGSLVKHVDSKAAPGSRTISKQVSEGW